MQWNLGLGLSAIILLMVAASAEAIPGSSEQIGFPLSVTQIISPEQIYISGSNVNPQTASVELILSNPPRRLDSLDVILILDTSQLALLLEVQALGEEIVSNLSSLDRVGVVTTSGSQPDAISLTSDFNRVREFITDLLPSSGNHLATSIQLAAEEFRFHGRPDATRIIILTGSGIDVSTGTNALIAQAEQARQAGIRIFPVATASIVDAKTLSKIAFIARGQFYTRFGPNTVASLFRQLRRDIRPPRDIVITEVLPPYIEYLGATQNPPWVDRTGPGGPTVLKWTIPSLPAGSTWQTTFTISSTKAGRVTVFSQDWRSRIVLVSEDGPFGPVRREWILPMLRLNVGAAPVADFSFAPSHPLTGDDVHFTDLSTPVDGRVVAWAWDFGDGETSTERNPTHRYLAPGTYVVKLLVTNEDGATAQDFKEITVAFREVTVPSAPPPPLTGNRCADEVIRQIFEILGVQEVSETIDEAKKLYPPLNNALNEIAKFAEQVSGRRWDRDTAIQFAQKIADLLATLAKAAVLNLLFTEASKAGKFVSIISRLTSLFRTVEFVYKLFTRIDLDRLKTYCGLTG